MNFERHSLSDDKEKSGLHTVFLVFVGVFTLLFATGIFSVVKVGLAGQRIMQNIQEPGNTTEVALELISNLGKPLDKDSQNRTNILLLGGGGLEHDEGSDLTDTLIVASLNHDTKQVYMISVPRDLFIKIPNRGFYRINTLWPLGQATAEAGHEADLAKRAFASITGLDIHYFVKVDFIGFEKVVDAIGGIDVVVDRTFTDYEYPDNNYGYMTVSFEAGPQHLDGEEALQFARSRHGNNNESGDFARAQRQQKVIKAIRDKALKLGLFGQPDEIENVINTVSDHYSTDITNEEILSLLSFGKNVQDGGIHTMVLQEGPGELLYVPTEEVRNTLYGGAYALLPDGDDFSIIQQAIDNFLSEPEQVLSGPKIEVLNGTSTPNLAHYVATELMREGLRILPEYGIRNTYFRSGYEETLIYDHSRGGNIEIVKEIQAIVGGEIAAETPEPKLYPVDITVILGDDFPIPEDLDRILGKDVNIEIEDETNDEETTGDSGDNLQ